MKKLQVLVLVAFAAAFFLPSQASALDFLQPSGSPYSTGKLTTNSVRTGDINGDGRDDVFTANADYSASIFLANPDGSMTQAPGSPITSSSYAISGTIGDFNGDGRLDMALAHNDSVTVRLGNGDGTFGGPTTFPTLSSGEDIGNADFNRDGNLDLLVLGYTENNVSVLLGNGDGTFAPPNPYPQPNGPISLVIADFNNDGNPDFATANLDSGPSSPGAVSVRINQIGFFTDAIGAPYPGYSFPRGITAGDFNHDGNQDLSAVARSDQELQVLLGGGLTFVGTIPALTNSNWGNSVASADFNGDSFDDVLVGMSTNISDPITQSAPIFLGNASGNLTASPDGPWATTSPAYPWEVATGDFNDDGHPDWVSGDQGGRISVFMNEAPALTADPTTLNFANVHVGEASSPMSATLTNTGIGPVEIDEGGVSITGTDASDYQIDSEDCDSATLNSGQSCQVDVVFSPSSTGAKSATLNVAHDANGSPTTVALTGTGTPNPGIDFDPTSRDFGDTRITLDSAPQTFKVTSSGTTPLDVDTVTLAGTDANQFEIDSETCTGSSPINPEGECEVVVHFAPTTVGAKSASLSLTTNVPGSPQTVALSGTGTPFGYPSWQPTSTDFGPVPLGSGPSAPKVFTMTAMGVSPLLVDQIFIAPNQLNAEDFSIVSDDCLGETFQPGETCQVAVTFEPSATGDRSARLRYYADIYTGILFLEGEGTDPDFTFTPATQDFGTRLTNEGPGTPQNFTLTSTGTTDLETDSVSLGGVAANQFQITSDGCSDKSLAPNESCDVSVAFAPTTAGEKVADLSVALQGAGPATAQLTGSGQDPVPPPDPCEPVAIKKVGYFTPSINKRSNIPGVRARVTTAGPAVVRISSKLIYHLNGKQGQVKYAQKEFKVAADSVNYKVAIPKNLRQKLKPKKQVRFVISYSSKAAAPECTKFGEKKTRNLTTRVVWVIPNA